MPPTDSTQMDGNEPLTASLFVRSLSPEGARTEQAQVVSRLHEFRDSGVLADVSLTVWGSRLHPVSARRTRTGREILDTICRFETWADRQDPPRSLCFGSRDVRSPITGDRETELVLPVMCLAIADRDRLRCVAPWREGSRVHAVSDCLDALGDPTRTDAHPPAHDVDQPLVQ